MKTNEKQVEIDELNNNDDLVRTENLEEVKNTTGVPIPDPEKSNDQWNKKPDMNIYYDQTEDNS